MFRSALQAPQADNKYTTREHPDEFDLRRDTETTNGIQYASECYEVTAQSGGGVEATILGTFFPLSGGASQLHWQFVWSSASVNVDSGGLRQTLSKTYNQDDVRIVTYSSPREPTNASVVAGHLRMTTPENATNHLHGSFSYCFPEVILLIRLIYSNTDLNKLINTYSSLATYLSLVYPKRDTQSLVHTALPDRVRVVFKGTAAHTAGISQLARCGVLVHRIQS